jgi:hypothetical protein
VFSGTVQSQSQTREALAVLRFYGSIGYTPQLQGLLTTELFKTNRFRLVERARLDDVIREMRLSSAQLNFRDIQRLGQTLGVAKIITGECNEEYVGGKTVYTATVRMINVQTGFMDISITSILEKENYGSDSVSLTDFLVMLAKDITRQILENY